MASFQDCFTAIGPTTGRKSGNGLCAGTSYENIAGMQGELRVREHVTPEELQAAAEGGLPPERAQEMVRHLIGGCAQCQAAARQVIFLPPALESHPLPPDVEAAYEATLDRAADFACRIERLPPEERDAFYETHSLLLSEGTEENLLSLSLRGVPLASFGACEALLARAWAVRYQCPLQMYDLAQMAANQAEALSPEVYGEREVADFQAHAWGELGNACRVADRLWEAEKAFGRAFQFFDRGTGDRQLKARLLDLQASLFGTLRHFRLSISAIDVVVRLYQELGDEHLAARSLITKALYTYYSGDAEKALELNAEGLAAIDREREPGLVVTAIKNELLYLVELGRFPEANRVLFDNRWRFQEVGLVVAARIRWIEGMISYGQERWPSAEATFREVAQRFEELNLVFHRALSGLYLAASLLQQENLDEAEAEVRTSLEVFRAFGVAWEATAAVIFLVQAFETRVVTADLVEAAARYIQKLQIEMGW
jgi:tetratricopeptide (TPR) repeat protein